VPGRIALDTEPAIDHLESGHVRCSPLALDELG
jgi:hypothetical protein